MNPNALFIEQAKPVFVNLPAAGSGAGTYISLKNYERVTFLISARNSTTVTASTISLKQALATAGTSEKTLSFSKAYKSADLGSSQQLSEVAVTGDTLTLDTTNSKDIGVAIEVDASSLDVKNDFDCVKLVLGNSTNQQLACTAILWPGKYQRLASPTPLTD